MNKYKLKYGDALKDNYGGTGIIQEIEDGKVYYRSPKSGNIYHRPLDLINDLLENGFLIILKGYNSVLWKVLNE